MTEEKSNNEKGKAFEFMDSVKIVAPKKKDDGAFEMVDTLRNVAVPETLTGKSSHAKETVNNVNDFDRTIDANVDNFDRTIEANVDDFDKTIETNIHDIEDSISNHNIEQIHNNSHVNFDQTQSDSSVNFDKTLNDSSIIFEKTLNDSSINFDQTINNGNVSHFSKKKEMQSIKFIGRYHALEEIASGGFGTVFKGYDPNLGREIAVKTIRFDKDIMAELDVFEKEARTLARCNHPNIVQVYDVGRNQESPYIVMEFINGPSICEYIKEQKSSKDTKHIQKVICSHMLALVDALSYIHKRKIYHQDIKPKNILVSLSNNCAKLVDFGLAIENPNPDKESAISGTYAYMAPEKFEGKGNPKMHDIYALGAVFYELLTGRPAHPGKTNTEVVQHVLNVDVSFFPEDEVDKKLKEICLKCLQNNPRERYQDVSQIYNDLMAYSGSATDVNEYPYLSLGIGEKKFVFPLTNNKNFLGRTFSNQIVIPDVSISRSQAMIEVEEENAKITNLSEVIKINVNGIDLKYEQGIELKGHEKIKIADYIFHYIPRSEISEYQEIVMDVEGGNSIVGHVISAISDSQKEAQNSGLSHSQIDSNMWEQTMPLQSNIVPEEAEEKPTFIPTPKTKNKNINLNPNDIEQLESSISQLKEMLQQFQNKLKGN